MKNLSISPKVTLLILLVSASVTLQGCKNDEINVLETSKIEKNNKSARTSAYITYYFSDYGYRYVYATNGEFTKQVTFTATNGDNFARTLSFDIFCDGISISNASSSRFDIVLQPGSYYNPHAGSFYAGTKMEIVAYNVQPSETITLTYTIKLNNIDCPVRVDMKSPTYTASNFAFADLDYVYYIRHL